MLQVEPGDILRVFAVRSWDGWSWSFWSTWTFKGRWNLYEVNGFSSNRNGFKPELFLDALDVFCLKRDPQ